MQNIKCKILNVECKVDNISLAPRFRLVWFAWFGLSPLSFLS